MASEEQEESERERKLRARKKGRKGGEVMSEDLVVMYYVEADFGWDPAIGKSKCTVKFSFATRC